MIRGIMTERVPEKMRHWPLLCVHDWKSMLLVQQQRCTSSRRLTVRVPAAARATPPDTGASTSSKPFFSAAEKREDTVDQVYLHESTLPESLVRTNNKAYASVVKAQTCSSKLATATIDRIKTKAVQHSAQSQVGLPASLMLSWRAKAGGTVEQRMTTAESGRAAGRDIRCQEGSYRTLYAVKSSLLYKD